MTFYYFKGKEGPVLTTMKHPIADGTVAMCSLDRGKDIIIVEAKDGKWCDASKELREHMLARNLIEGFIS